jgi:hypothetical protein
MHCNAGPGIELYDCGVRLDKVKAVEITPGEGRVLQYVPFVASEYDSTVHFGGFCLTRSKYSKLVHERYNSVESLANGQFLDVLQF